MTLGTPPRFSLLHLAAFGVALAITTAVPGNWGDFRTGLRNDYNSAASPSPHR